MKFSRIVSIIGILAFVFLPLLFAGGCAGLSGGKAADSFDQAARMYYQQERVFQPFSLTGINEFTIKGTNMAMNTAAPLNPLSILPKDPDTMGDLINAGASVARFGLGAWAVKGTLDNVSESPRVVNQPEPVIVKPQVITTR